MQTATGHRDAADGVPISREQVGGVEVGPLAHLADERRRLASLEWRHFDVERVGTTLGAVVHGLDLSVRHPDEVIDEMRRALTDYKVLFFRDQPLTARQHVEFAQRFGELEVHPFSAANDDEPHLVRLAKSPEVGGFENAWHHDVTWREVPSMGAILHAVEVPSVGGDTLFADMHAAYDGLPSDVRDLIDSLDAEHDYMRAFGRQVPAERAEETRRTYPPVRHPVAPRHPVSGRRYLYVNPFFTSFVDGEPAGLTVDESADLLALLLRQANIVEYQCRFSWRPHSIAFWDNRAVQHYAASDYWPERRLVERASIIGTRPTR